MTQFLGMLAAIALTALCWGVYGPVIHEGQGLMGSRLRPFMCVGAAYFLIAVIVPALLLARGGEKGSWTMTGVLWSLLAGACGALGALGVILALAAGGKPIYVMPLVFGGAPVVNTLLSAFLNRAFAQLKAPFIAGLLLVITGAVTVLIFKPQPAAHGAPAATAKAGETPAGDAKPAADEPQTTDTAAGKAAKVVEKRTERFVEVLLAVALTVLCWGAYGPVLHKGQMAMQGSRLRPLLCIGLAYFLIAVLVPLALLGPLGDSGNWSVSGVLWSIAGGSLGALGALGTILAFTMGGKPFTVMPVVFGCAPVINTLTSSLLQGTSLANLSPFFLAGMLIVGVGAATVLAFGPRGHAPPKPA
jgi:drug/metabolite transporter (DMT)-like permease